MDDDSRQDDARLLIDFSTNGVLDRLRRLDEPGQGGVPVWREALGPAEEDALGVGGHHGYDDGRVGAGERQV